MSMNRDMNMSDCNTVKTPAAVASCEDKEKKNHVRLEAVMWCISVHHGDMVR
jgi:hypothetical protein